jgi:methionine-gamma-lyase
MAAISNVILQLCNSGDEIVSSRTIYGGTYAFFKNYLPKFNIKTHFVDATKTELVEKAITPNTKIIYCETLSNPLLEVMDIKALAQLAKKHNCKLVVDNTFSPLIFSPAILGADIVVHSMTKFINGMSDCVAGAICGSKEFIDSLSDVNSGTSMLLGPVLDSFRSAGILKNLRTLHVRMKKHSENALYIAERLKAQGLKVIYPGLKDHPQHQLFQQQWNEEYGFGGLFVIDMGTKEKANQLMETMQNANIGYLAVSLGSYKTLFSAPGGSTSSEIPEEERLEIGLTEGLVRVSIGLDNNIERTYQKMLTCINDVNQI